MVFPNLSNYCFANSVIQILCATKIFSVPLGNGMFAALNEIILRLDSGQDVTTEKLKNFINTVGGFHNWGNEATPQEDASEFLNKILENTAGGSWKFETRVTAWYGIDHSDNRPLGDTTPGNVLNVAITSQQDKIYKDSSMSNSYAKPSNVQEAIDKHFGFEEENSGDLQLEDGTTPIRAYLRKTDLISSSKFFIISLNRFESNNGISTKRNDSITPNERITVVLGGQHREYELKGVIVHLGQETLNSGHYVTYRLEGGVWWLLDDKTIKKIGSYGTMKGHKGTSGSETPSTGGYIFLYEQVRGD